LTFIGCGFAVTAPGAARPVLLRRQHLLPRWAQIRTGSAAIVILVLVGAAAIVLALTIAQ